MSRIIADRLTFNCGFECHMSFGSFPGCSLELKFARVNLPVIVFALMT